MPNMNYNYLETFKLSTAYSTNRGRNTWPLVDKFELNIIKMNEHELCTRQSLFNTEKIYPHDNQFIRKYWNKHA